MPGNIENNIINDMDDIVVSVRDIHVVLGGRTILKDINFDLKRGETLAVMGLSGAGKSTLLRCILGLLKPASGEIYVLGKQISKLNGKGWDDLRKNIGMVFQYPALFDSLTIMENVGFGLIEHSKMPIEEIRKLVSEKLATVDLIGTEDMYPNELSGGMQKRASFARAVITNPHIILYDEPTTGLDPIMLTVIDNLIKEIKKETSASAIIVTHDIKTASAVADKIAMIYEGRIIEIGEVSKVMQSDNPVVRQFMEGSTTGPIKV
ncbi:MAG: ABC transporter ATP-binding protein [Chloroflexi bacterium]|nr:ABC transporter ATP-binding protein [Chloroflexota bacterium]